MEGRRSGDGSGGDGRGNEQAAVLFIHMADVIDQRAGLAAGAARSTERASRKYRHSGLGVAPAAGGNGRRRRRGQRRACSHSLHSHLGAVGRGLAPVAAGRGHPERKEWRGRGRPGRSGVNVVGIGLAPAKVQRKKQRCGAGGHQEAELAGWLRRRLIIHMVKMIKQRAALAAAWRGLSGAVLRTRSSHSSHTVRCCRSRGSSGGSGAWAAKRRKLRSVSGWHRRRAGGR